MKKFDSQKRHFKNFRQNIKKILIPLSVICALFLAECSTGKRALQKGDYYKATIDAVNRLHSSPENQKAQQVLLQSYPLAKDAILRNIKNSLAENRSNKYAIIVRDYLDLNQLASIIYSSPKALELIPSPSEYYSELKKAKELAAEESYSLGTTALAQKTIQAAREAYYHFIDANNFLKGYRDVNSKIDEALFMATLKVVVSKPITSKNYQLSADFFYDNLISQMEKETKFVRFYTYQEAKKENLKYPDQIIVLDFNDFSVGNIRESKNTTEISKDNILVGTVKEKGENKNVYGTVKAYFTVFRREVISAGTLNVRIVEEINNRTLENKKFSGSYTWYNEWASYKGDERALTEKQLRMSNNDNATMPPPNQDLFIEFTKPIFDQTVRYVKYYYSKY